MLDDTDRQHLRRCVALAEQALDAGDEPFGSVLVSADGEVLFESRNRVSTGDALSHPEFDLARWAANNLNREQRAATTAYTSGEHCPMCSAAHGWAGLGRLVYASSSRQLSAWLADLDVPPGPITMHPVEQVVPGVAVAGPDDELAEQVRQLHYRNHAQL